MKKYPICSFLGKKFSQLWVRGKPELQPAELERFYRLSSILKEHPELGGVQIHIIAHADKERDPITRNVSGFGIGGHVCLTEYHGVLALRHELGHCLQNMELGDKFLTKIAVPSVLGNIIYRYAALHAFFNKPASYYDQPWEADANTRMGVVRASSL